MVSKETTVTTAIIIAIFFEFKHICALLNKKFSQLGEDKSASVIQQKQNMGKIKYALLRNTLIILSFGEPFPKYNYMFCIDTIKVVSLIQHIKENLQLKAGRLRNVIISCHKSKTIPVYDRGGKGIRLLFK